MIQRKTSLLLSDILVLVIQNNKYGAYKPTTLPDYTNSSLHNVNFKYPFTWKKKKRNSPTYTEATIFITTTVSKTQVVSKEC